ncbi:hypothetical protein [Kitasatospora sp. NPDC089509]|uniref:MmyB family transcriptional regulator n=1 Tax=Kitasatospora sp. NPDC089509 TaxID=3364079 RepID=UPI0037F79407
MSPGFPSFPSGFPWRHRLLYTVRGVLLKSVSRDGPGKPQAAAGGSVSSARRSNTRRSAQPARRTARRLRSAYGRHVGEPVREEHVRRLSARSELFREVWARQEVAPPKTLLRIFRHPELGVLRLNATYLTMPGVPECYIVVYVPEDPDDREPVGRLDSLPPGGWRHTCKP